MTQKTRILLEVGHTAKSNLNTGIQRVVRNIAARMIELAPRHGVEVVLVAVTDAGLVPVSLDRPPAAAAPASSALRWWRDYLLGIVRASRQLVAALVPSPRVRSWLLASRHEPGISRWLVGLLQRAGLVRGLPVAPGAPAGLAIDPARDQLLLLDSSWMDNIWPSVKRLREQGLEVGAVSYDLIPLSHPQFCDEGLVGAFAHWMDQGLGLVDRYYCISRATRDELRHYITTQRGADRVPPMDVFQMGATVVTGSGDAAAPVRDGLAQCLGEGEHVYLSVSTLEPRKNHGLLLDAFDRLWAQGLPVRLLLVGKVGWKVDALMRRIHTHPMLGKRLFFFSDLSDDELVQAYRGAHCLLFPSFVEGYGLPIIEALHNGLPVMASDTPVHREVGGDRIGYFPVDAPEALAALVTRLEADGIPAALRPVPGQAPTWEASAASLLACLTVRPAAAQEAP